MRLFGGKGSCGKASKNIIRLNYDDELISSLEWLPAERGYFQPLEPNIRYSIRTTSIILQGLSRPEGEEAG